MRASLPGDEVSFLFIWRVRFGFKRGRIGAPSTPTRRFCLASKYFFARHLLFVIKNSFLKKKCLLQRIVGIVVIVGFVSKIDDFRYKIYFEVYRKLITAISKTNLLPNQRVVQIFAVALSQDGVDDVIVFVDVCAGKTCDWVVKVKWSVPFPGIRMTQKDISRLSANQDVYPTNVVSPLRGSVIQSTSYPVESKQFSYQQSTYYWCGLRPLK